MKTRTFLIPFLVLLALTAATTSAFSVDWSPDGKKLAVNGAVMQDAAWHGPRMKASSRRVEV